MIFYIAENYWEVSGILNAIKGGIDPKSVRRPLDSVEIRIEGGEVSSSIKSLDDMKQQLKNVD